MGPVTEFAAEHIEGFLERTGWTRSRLGAACGTDRLAVSRILKGKATMQSADHMVGWILENESEVHRLNTLAREIEHGVGRRSRREKS